MKNKESGEKALFFQRLMAFLIDVLIVTLLTSFLSSPFVNNKKIEKLSEDIVNLAEKYGNKEIDTKKYVADYVNVSYDLAKENGPVVIIQILLGIGFYIIVPLYSNGQSVGKKILKIKVISEDGELTSNQLVFRSFIANSLLVDILSLTFLIFTSRSMYFYLLAIFKLIQYIITFISIVLVIYSKKGLAIHDRIVHTRVVRC